MIFPKWPYFDNDEKETVTQVLSSGNVNYWTGNECKLFESEFNHYLGTKYAISLANGTVALETALHALDIGAGDEVIVPCRTFIASASCIVELGAKPIVVDIDPISQNLTAATIATAITPRTKAIIVVHLAGWPCDMDPILELAHKHNIKIIEDCAQALGAKYKGKHVGSFGDVAAFSFCQDKIISTGGEGGMLTTNNKNIWEKAWAYKDHGKNPNMAFSEKTSAGFRWLHESFGTNFRLTEIQAAIGRIQLSKLPNWLQTRKRNANILTSYCKKIPLLRTTEPPTEFEHAYYKYYTFILSDKLKSDWNRERILDCINSKGVPCGSGSCGEIYLEKAFLNYGLEIPQRFKNAQQLAETSLMFLVHPTLTEEHMHYTGQIISDIFACISQ